MYSQYLFLAIAGVWLVLLSLAFFLLMRFFNRLTKGVDQGDLKTILEKILIQEAKNRDDLEELNRQIGRIDNEAVGYIQKMGIVRFNPFREIGGDHSFSIALLDGVDSGIIITGLHTRERTRVYIKSVKKGKSEHSLSDEEKKAFVKAQKLKSK
jgi:hypothetical protein